MHFNLINRVLVILAIFVALVKAKPDPRCIYPMGRMLGEWYEPGFGGTPVDHKLTTAEQNGKALDLGDETKYAYVCVNDESSGSANGTKEMIPHWIEVWSGHYTYKREQRVHFSLEPVESKPDHYKLIHRYGKFLGRGEKAEYFRMFENGGELKIVKIENKERFPGNLKGPLIIESSKLNRTYHYRADPIYGCAYPSC